jgi:hypothetical protein
VKLYKEVSRTIKEKIIGDTLCDICGLSEKKWENTKGQSWGYHEEEVSLSHKITQTYCGEGTTNEIDLDICPVCFRDKIFPFVKSISYKPENIEYREIDW